MKTFFKDLDEFSKEIGISKDNLISVFKIESEYHKKILDEGNFRKRVKMCEDMYQKSHSYLIKRDNLINIKKKEYRLKIFKKFLYNRSIIDIGCGDGTFLKAISNNIIHKKLVGIDIFKFNEGKFGDIVLKNKDIIKFNLKEKFDIAFSDNVLEHIPPQDISIHLECIRRILNKNGKLIIITPNKIFGPHDITRIIDNTYTNKIESKGSHLKEYSYSELYDILTETGFKKIYSLIPIKFINLNINIKFLKYIEKSPKLIRILYKLRRNGKPIYKLPIILICEK